MCTHIIIHPSSYNQEIKKNGIKIFVKMYKMCVQIHSLLIYKHYYFRSNKIMWIRKMLI